MAKLILAYDRLVLRELELEQPRFVIGRDVHNDLQIDVPDIPPRQVQLMMVGTGYQFQDLTGSQQVRVNEECPGRRILGDNDCIWLNGNFSLRYRTFGPVVMRRNTGPGSALPSLPPLFDPPGRATAEALHELTQQIEGQPAVGGNAAPPLPARPDAPAQPPALTVQPAGSGNTVTNPAPPLARLAAIRLVSGANAGKTLMLAKELSRLGTPGVQVVAIARKPEGYFLTHVEGSPPPRINGQEVIGHLSYPLNERDLIDIQGNKMEFFFAP